MKSTTTTNVLLGIIAFCLIINLLTSGGLITKAYADTPHKAQSPTEVVIVGMKRDAGLLPVSVESFKGNSVRTAIPVNIELIEGKEIDEARAINVMQRGK